MYIYLTVRFVGGVLGRMQNSGMKKMWENIFFCLVKGEIGCKENGSRVWVFSLDSEISLKNGEKTL